MSIFVFVCRGHLNRNFRVYESGIHATVCMFLHPPNTKRLLEGQWCHAGNRCSELVTTPKCQHGTLLIKVGPLFITCTLCFASFTILLHHKKHRSGCRLTVAVLLFTMACVTLSVMESTPTPAYTHTDALERSSCQ